jgi:heme exporter protein A
VIEIKSLTKNYGLKPVLRGVDLTIQPGEFVALLGPNGAGKSTLLRIVASLARPSLGRVRVAGYELPAQADAVRQLLGVVSHQPLLYSDLTAEENLRFYGEMYGVASLSRRIADVLEQVGLSRRRRDLVRTFSRGMIQRLTIGRAILHAPQVMLFDEPHTGLDPAASQMLDSVLLEVAAQGRTVLMISHDLPHALTMANRIAILARGRIVYDAPAQGLNAAGFGAYFDEAVRG